MTGANEGPSGSEGSTGSEPGKGGVGQPSRRPSPLDYKPEFVGGAGGGAKDPDYEYVAPKDGDSTKQPVEVW